MKVLVDTSAWLALADQHDQSHRQATALFEQLKAQRTVLVLSEWVLAESLTAIRHHVNFPAAVRFGRAVFDSHLAELVVSEETLRRKAWAIFQRYDDKDFSFVDCTSFAVMEQLKLQTAFAFDRHFEQYGFHLLGQ